MKNAEKQELFGKLKKERLLKELNDLNKGLISYKRRQEKHGQTKFTEGQKKNLDALRLRLQQKYNWLRETISKYGGDVSIKIVGMPWDTFIYSLHSLYMVPDQFTALDRAINVVNRAIEKIESTPVASTDWRDISITLPPKDYTEETSYLFETMQFHPKIIEASKSLFESGFYAQAIFEAFKAVNNFVKEKTGLSPNEIRRMKDSQLMAKVFDANNPIIKVNELLTDTDISEQEGFKLLFMGATMGIRNPKAHDLIEMKDPYKTLEYLAFASLLLKKIDFWEAA